MSSRNNEALNWKPAKSWLIFILLTVVIIWTAHLVGFFPHEYSHSFTAWIMGWKSNPIDLNYGPPTTANLLLQSDIDENEP